MASSACRRGWALASLVRIGVGAVAGAGLLVTSCGFLGEEPFRGRRSPDVAPWRDLGPVTFENAGDAREPSPLVDENQVVLYVERRSGAAGEVWRATSQDGVQFRFTPARPVLTPDVEDAGRAGAPTVLRQSDGNYLLAYANGAGQLRRATSRDGIAFTVDPAPLLVPSRAWEQSGLDAPALAPAPAGGLLLYYGTVARDAIGVAESADGILFRAAAEPVLVPDDVMDPVLWRKPDRIASPFAEAARDPRGQPFLRIYFSARGQESGATVQDGVPTEIPPNFSVGEAATTDGRALIPWPFNPIFDRVQVFVRHPAELEPAVIPLGNRRLLYYRSAAADESPPTNLGVAENPVGG
jgi:hypothetical protein